MTLISAFAIGLVLGTITRVPFRGRMLETRRARFLRQYILPISDFARGR